MEIKLGNVYACKWDNDEDAIIYYNHVHEITSNHVFGECLFSTPVSVTYINSSFSSGLARWSSNESNVIDLGPIEKLKDEYPERFI